MMIVKFRGGLVAIRVNFFSDQDLNCLPADNKLSSLPTELSIPLVFDLYLLDLFYKRIFGQPFIGIDSSVGKALGLLSAGRQFKS